VRGADETLVPPTALRASCRPACDGVHRSHAPRDRPARRERGRPQRDERRRAAAAARGRDAPDVRTKRRHLSWQARVEPVEDGRGRRRDPGIDGAPETAGKGHVDRPMAELGVEAANRVPTRAGDLVLHVPRQGDDHPGPRDGDAHHQPAALVRGARLTHACDQRRDHARGQRERAPHRTLLNQAVESIAPTRRNIAAPAEK
jgi:hypothetical protein